MKKKLFALSGVFLIVLVITGFWATRATDILSVEEEQSPGATSLATGQSMPEMVQGASLIVISKCVGSRVQWIGGSLFTVATVSVTEKIKDDVGAPEKVDVFIPGGADANRRFPVAQTVPGAPMMSLDDEAALFLVPQEGVENGYSVMGLARGFFPISLDSDGEKVITPHTTRGRVHDGVGNLQVTRLAEFRKRVTDLLNK